MNKNEKHIAIFGASGYIGQRLLNKLYNKNYKITIFVRDKNRFLNLNNKEYKYLKNKGVKISIVEVNISINTLPIIIENLKNIETVYYLIHSLYVERNQNYVSKDNELADIISYAAKKANVKKIIYLGGLGINDKNNPLSLHIISRQETAKILRKNFNNVIEVRTGIIIGAGNSSFEIIKKLAEFLPFIITSKKEGKVQTIFVDDIIKILMLVLEANECNNKIIEVASEKTLSYSDTVKIYAKEILKKNLPVIKLPNNIYKKIFNEQRLAKIISYLTNLPEIMIERLIEGKYSIAVINNKYHYNKVCPDIAKKIKLKSYEDSIKLANIRYIHEDEESIWKMSYEMSIINYCYKKNIYFSKYLKNGMLMLRIKKLVKNNYVDLIWENINKLGNNNFFDKYLVNLKAKFYFFLGIKGVLFKYKQNKKKLSIGDKIYIWNITYIKNTNNEKRIRLKNDYSIFGTEWIEFDLIKLKNNYFIFSIDFYYKPYNKIGYLIWYINYPFKYFIFKKLINKLVLKVNINYN